jgi:IS5 family transposase
MSSNQNQFKNQFNQNSFFGNFLYNQIIPPDHFLKKLSKVVDFSFINELCSDLYHLEGPGQKPYQPEFLFKILFLSFLYNISDREVEEQVNFNILFKWFCGLAINEKAPDYSTLSVFRERLGQERFEQIFNQIVKIASDYGLTDSKLRIIDSTHTQANVDLNRLTKEYKEKLEKEPEKLKEKKINTQNYISKTSSDPDARFGRKSKKKIFYGYKEHFRINGQNSIVEKVSITSGNVNDNQEFENLVRDLPPGSQVTADKEYDTNQNHKLIKEKQSESFIILKKNRKKPELLAKKETKIYQEITRKRPIIERIIAEAKRYHGLAKSRWKSKWKMAIQALLTFIVLNCKRLASWLLSPPGQIPVFSFQNRQTLTKKLLKEH